MIAPTDEELVIETQRLILEPILEVHAEEIHDLLSDASLYKFIPGDPLPISELQARYKRWEARISPKHDEIWLNWVAREKKSKTLIGHFQAGFGDTMESSVAYTIGTSYQRQGYAREALTAMIALLFEKMNVRTAKAWIDTTRALLPGCCFMTRTVVAFLLFGNAYVVFFVYVFSKHLDATTSETTRKTTIPRKSREWAGVDLCVKCLKLTGFKELAGASGNSRESS